MLKSLFRFIFGKGLILLAGLLVGLAIFAPWDRIWNRVLTDLNQKAPGVTILWNEIEHATFTGAKLKEFKLRWPKFRIEADSVDIRLGLLTPVKATIVTGPEKLNLTMNWGKTLRLLGKVELGTFLGMNRTAGMVGIDGTISWENFASPPVSGKIAMDSSTLTWECKTTLEQFGVRATLEQTLLNLNSLRFTKPMPVDIAGVLELNWKALGLSTGQVEGSMNLGGEPQNFNKQGTLGELLGLIGM